MKYKIPLIILLVLFLGGSIGFAQMICPLNNSPLKPKGVKSLAAFEKIAILDQGRVKPLETYARNVLLQFSGRRSFERKPAIDWLARFLFAPETTRKDKIFLINNPEIAQALSVEPEKERRYNFNQLEKHYEKLAELAAAAFKIPEKERSLVDNEILRVQENILLYARLSRSFVFAFPHEEFTVIPEVRESLDFPADYDQFSFIDIALRADKIYKASAGLEKKDETQWSEVDQNLGQLMSSLYQWSQEYRDLPLIIIPSYEQDERWISPWDVFGEGFQTPEGREEVSLLRNLMVAYWNGQQLEFDLAARAFNESIKKRFQEGHSKILAKIPLEIVYNKFNLFLVAKLFYGLAFLVFLFSLVWERKIFQGLAVGFIAAGFIPHLIALIMRAMILTRPPVSSLYETFIFVSFVAVLLGLLIEGFNKQWLGIVVASVCGFVFLVIASKFSTEGDTLKMLVAVLNSNFWLSTHVLSITIGYAGSCVAGIVGHMYILQAIARPKDKKLLESTYRNLLGILGFGLAMTFLGTNLGGIWADQSWGRFWGWDPKENGALLIVIWTAMTFHAKIARMVGPLGVAVMSALLIIVVMWAWFGVNLLSIGLHSYGFTSGSALNLTIYVVLQVLFLVIAVPIADKKLRS